MIIISINMAITNATPVTDILIIRIRLMLVTSGRVIAPSEAATV